MKGDSMRGLAVFISDIRNCKSRELEIKRINKELANIRSKFKGDKPLDGYQKKKYVCKLLFIFLLGHDIDFGHEMAVNLLQSNKYTEKQIGYLFISVLIGASSELLKMIVLAVRNDLQCRNPVFINLALQCIANIGSRDMTEAFNQDVSKLLVSSETIDSVKQSAALCLLGMVRSAPDAVQFGEWSSRVVHLLNDQHLGVVTASISLIDALARRSPEEYRGCVALAISRLNRIVSSTYTDLQDYTYYFVACPWLCVKLLRVLQNYPPPEDPTHRSKLNECLENVLAKAQEAPKSKKVQHSNAKNAVLFEAINLIIHLDCDAALLVKACQQLGQFLAHRETNLRYLALESMCLLATSEFSHEAVKKHQETVINALKTEKDVSVRQRAVDLLYAMCDKTNAENIVGEMLAYLELADYAIREEMVLKIAILAEKYATDYTWYVDTILNLIRIAGDYVSEEVWYRVIQIVINRDDVQAYAASMCFQALRAPACHENMVKVGGYILGEFGNLIAGEPKSNALAQFGVLHEKFPLCSSATRGLLLTTYLKFVNLFPELKSTVLDALRNDSNIRSSDVEIQQRAVEYANLAELAAPDVLATVLEEMPPFPERESSILAKLKRKNAPAGDSLNNTPQPSTMPQPKMSSAQPAASGTNGPSIDKKPEAPQQPPANAEADLLGLNLLTSTAPSVAAASASANRSDALVDVFESATQQLATALGSEPNSSNELTPGSDAGFTKLVLKNSGVLFENDLIQIGIKSEYRQNLGRMGIFYGNKTQLPFTNFAVTLIRSGSAEQQAAANVTVKSLERPMIDQGAQVQQQVNVECLSEFDDVGTLQIRITQAGVSHTLNLRLPVTVNKFLETTEMDSTAFFNRWKQLAGPAHESQRIFKAKFNMNDTAALAQKWTAFGLANLLNIDPNSENLVGAGIVHTTRGQIGVLARLEPNKQTGMYRLTVRSTRQALAARFTELLEVHL